MLNNEELRELGKFKVLMHRIHNQSVKIEKFLSDIEYQSSMLDLAEEFNEQNLDDDELIVLSLTLRSRLGRLAEGVLSPATVSPETPPLDKVPESLMQLPTEIDQNVEGEKKRYFTGLR